ncbi:tetratricopeptide repeat protein [Sphingomicrobium astaxanthinifaciens]|uniref:tetratricopeptide repeat protein n=1 Tax=Sphingomicrobium astaxanthinifaciens TaxID=1227949 RepID=UPI001FCB12CF|nr:tetratricopeptide repeat protein [Sphingomicrobium astaxanthinifaciens]MCJ7420787.1 tetratricopeptide repeat protein [Sphingomicrobium astaxanthinifaciens]
MSGAKDGPPRDEAALADRLEAAREAARRGAFGPLLAIDDWSAPSALEALRDWGIAACEAHAAWPELRTVLKRALGSHGEEIDLLVALARAHAADRRDDEALAILERADVDDPDDPRLLAARFGLLLRVGQRARAERLLRSRLATMALPGGLLSELLRHLVASAYHAEAVALYDRNASRAEAAADELAIDAARALGDDARAEAIAAAAAAAGRQSLAATLVQARGERAAGAFEAAIDRLEAAREVHGMSAPLGAALAKAQLAAGRVEEAEAGLRAAVAQDPEDARLRILLGQASSAAGKFEDAIEQFRDATRLAPAEIDAHRQIVALLHRLGYRDRAAMRMAVLRGALAEKVPADLDAALARDDLPLPAPERVAWAQRLCPGADRAALERGHRVALGLEQWLEVVPDAPAHLAARTTLAAADREFLLEALAKGRGLVLATAHLAGLSGLPLLFDMLGVEGRAVVDRPSALHPFEPQVISAAQQSDGEVARAALATLERGEALLLAVDRRPVVRPSMVRVGDHHLPYQSVAARLAHHRGAPSAFVSLTTADPGFRFLVEPLPRRGEDEPLDPFLDRWRDAYLASLERRLAGPPVDLGLEGGIWEAG